MEVEQDGGPSAECSKDVPAIPSTNAPRGLFLTRKHVLLSGMSLPDEPEARREYGEKLKSHPGYESMASLIAALLDDRGCPWDRARKLEDCPEFIKSELEEVIQAIESGDDANLEEELGDLLFMVAFTMMVAENEGRTATTGVFERILNKMVHRHPHVFGGEMQAETEDEVLDNWSRLKEQEKANKSAGSDD